MLCTRILPVLFVIVSLLPTAIAQRTTANIYGIVSDSTGAVLARATVRLGNAQTGTAQEFSTNEAGEFSASFLPVGTYDLRVERDGFKAFERRNIVLSAGQQVRLPITLEIGQVTERLLVTDTAPLVQNASVQTNDAVNRLQVDSLPQPNRDFTQLLTLQPGVERSSRELMRINGLASAGITVTIDGVDAAGNAETSLISMFGGRNEINIISQEAVSEVNIAKGVISAEVGRAFSGNINVITKSGSNEFHGSLFENWRNDVLNARYALFTPRDRKLPIRFHQFGGSIGGRLIRDKTFFFVAYEGYRQSNFQVLSGLVPTPEFRAQAIAALPAYRQILELYPNPTDPYAPGAANAFFQGSGSILGNDNHIVARGDHYLNARHRLSARYTRGRPFSQTQNLVARNPLTFDYAADSANSSWVASGATWSNEARFGINFTETNRLNEFFNSGLPSVALQGGFTLSAERMDLYGHTYSIENIFSRTLGRHTVKTGGAFFMQAPGRFNAGVPLFTYANPAALLANNPNVVLLTPGVPRFYGSTWNLAGFVQDDFRVRKNLVLNLGLRYEFYSVFKDRDGLLFNPGNLANAFANPVRFLPAGEFYQPDYNNFLPRVGLAWTPGASPKTTLRAGFGVSVAPFDLRNFYTLAAIDQNILFQYRFTGADINRLNLRYPISTAQSLDLLRRQNVPRTLEVFDENSVNPYSLQWTLDLQRELTPQWLVRLGYVGTRGVKVGMNHNINQPDRLTGQRPFPHILESSWRNSAESSTYHALQALLQRRFAQGLQLNLSYTWAKTLAIVQGDYYGGNDPEVQDESNLAADWGPVAGDRKHSLAADFAYTLPLDRVGKQPKALRLFSEGWQLGGILRAASGSALNPTQASVYRRQRPDFNGADPYLDNADRFLFLNRAALNVIPNSPAGIPLRPGNAGKGSLRGPGRVNADLSVSKVFAIRERFQFRFRAEAFNATNSVILQDPVLEATRADYGQIRSVDPARVLQLSLRLSF